VADWPSEETPFTLLLASTAAATQPGTVLSAINVAANPSISVSSVVEAAGAADSRGPNSPPDATCDSAS
jgi:hypothetical protein